MKLIVYDFKFYVGCIKIGHMDFIPLQVLEGCSEGSCFVIVLVIINWFTEYKEMITSFSVGFCSDLFQH